MCSGFMDHSRVMDWSVLSRARAAGGQAAAGAGVGSAVGVGAGADEPAALDLCERIDSLGLRRPHGGTAKGTVEQPAGAQRHIAHHLRVEPQAMLPGEKLVTRIDLAQFGTVARGLPVG